MLINVYELKKLDSLNNDLQCETYRDKDSILDHKYEKQKSWDLDYEDFKISK